MNVSFFFILIFLSSSVIAVLAKIVTPVAVAIFLSHLLAAVSSLVQSLHFSYLLLSRRNSNLHFRYPISPRALSYLVCFLISTVSLLPCFPSPRRVSTTASASPPGPPSVPRMLSLISPWHLITSELLSFLKALSLSSLPPPPPQLSCPVYRGSVYHMFPYAILSCHCSYCTSCLIFIFIFRYLNATDYLFIYFHTVLISLPTISYLIFLPLTACHLICYFALSFCFLKSPSCFGLVSLAVLSLSSTSGLLSPHCFIFSSATLLPILFGLIKLSVFTRFSI